MKFVTVTHVGKGVIVGDQPRSLTQGCGSVFFCDLSICL